MPADEPQKGSDESGLTRAAESPTPAPEPLCSSHSESTAAGSADLCAPAFMPPTRNVAKKVPPPPPVRQHIPVSTVSHLSAASTKVVTDPEHHEEPAKAPKKKAPPPPVRHRPARSATIALGSVVKPNAKAVPASLILSSDGDQAPTEPAEALSPTSPSTRSPVFRIDSPAVCPACGNNVCCCTDTESSDGGSDDDSIEDAGAYVDGDAAAGPARGDGNGTLAKQTQGSAGDAEFQTIAPHIGERSQVGLATLQPKLGVEVENELPVEVEHEGNTDTGSDSDAMAHGPREEVIDYTIPSRVQRQKSSAGIFQEISAQTSDVVEHSTSPGYVNMPNNSSAGRMTSATLDFSDEPEQYAVATASETSPSPQNATASPPISEESSTSPPAGRQARVATISLPPPPAVKAPPHPPTRQAPEAAPPPRPAPASAANRARLGTVSITHLDPSSAKITTAGGAFESVGSLSTSSLRGWFKKEVPDGRVGKARRRFFVMRGSTIAYFASEGGDKNGENRKGHIGITAHTRCLCQGTTLKIHNLDRVWTLCADSEQQVANWGERLAIAVAQKKASLGAGGRSADDRRVHRSYTISTTSALDGKKKGGKRSQRTEKKVAKPTLTKASIGGPIQDSFTHISHLGMDSVKGDVAGVPNSPEGDKISEPIEDSGATSVAGARLKSPATPTSPRQMGVDCSTWMHDAVPYSFRACISYLCDPWCLKEEGLFRVSGNKVTIDGYLRSLNEGEPIELENCRDPATICGLLKRLIKESEVPFSSHESRGLQLAMFANEDEDEYTDVTLISNMQKLVCTLSNAKTATAQACLRLFGRIVKDPSNKMNFSNLGTAVGPTFFPSVPVQKCGDMLRLLCTYMFDVWPDAVHSPDDWVPTSRTMSPVRHF